MVSKETKGADLMLKWKIRHKSKYTTGILNIDRKTIMKLRSKP